MNFRSRWKRCMAAVMLAGMAASGLTAYAEEAQSGTATPETAQPTVTATPETAAQDAPAVAMYAAPRRAAVSTFALDKQSADDVDTQDADEIDYSLGAQSDDIALGNFTPDDNTYYGSATFYDYYGDYERAGNMLSKLKDLAPAAANEVLSSYGAKNGDDWNDQTAKQWNTAISDYFFKEFKEDKTAVAPLYFGGARYFGNHGQGNNATFKNSLYNFTMKRTGGNGFSDAAVTTPTGATGAFFPNQGIAANALDENDQLLLKTNDGGRTPAPYFNKSFVLNEGNADRKGPNGQVYENVTFPFTWDKTTSTWLFDSTKDGAQIKQDEKSGGYFIDRNGTPVRYIKDSNSKDDSKFNFFFPFNTAGQVVASNEAYKLNYMFGMQLELPFNLTADRMSTVVNEDGKTKKVDTVFRFAGDDDIWVYIDGHLVLDMGGSHGTVAGAIDFTTGNYMVSGQWDGESTNAAAMSNTAFWTETQNAITDEYMQANAAYCTTGKLTTALGKELTTGVRHTIQIFYMERGWDESNLKMSFNFSQSSMVDVSKSVNTTQVSSALFQDVLDDLQAQLDAETYTFQVSAQKNEAGAKLQPAANSPYTLVEQGTKQTLDKNGTMQLQAGQVARFTNEFAYDSYLQISETSKANDARFTPHWTLKEVDSNGSSQIVTKAQAAIDPKDDTPLQNMPGNTPYDERVADGVAAREAGTQSLLLRPFNTGSEKVRLRIDYVNELRTGSLTLRKQLADGTTPAEGSFTLRVKFDNVGGTSVTKTVDITLDKANGYTKTLDGIPYDTTYTVYEVKQDGWELKEIRPSAAKGAQQEGVYDLYYTGTLADDTDNGRVVTFRNSPVNKPTTSPTPETPTGPSPSPAPDKPAGPTATPSTPNVPGSTTPAPANTPQPGSDTPAATATPTVTPSAAQGKTTGSTPAPTAQVTSAIPQTEDTSHPILLCLLCVAGAFGFGIVIAKWNIRREQ